MRFERPPAWAPSTGRAVPGELLVLLGEARVPTQHGGLPPRLVLGRPAAPATPTRKSCEMPKAMRWSFNGWADLEVTPLAAASAEEESRTAGVEARERARTPLPTAAVTNLTEKKNTGERMRARRNPIDLG